MHEGFTLEKQRQIEEERGWQPTYSALTYCTAETVIIRNVLSHGRFRLLDIELLVAERISGAPDCLGKTQSKWGEYVRPTDPTPLYALRRMLNETLGWDSGRISPRFTGLIGPWVYQSLLKLVGDQLILTISDVQGETTPFQASLFTTVVPYDYEPGEGKHLSATENIRWVKLRNLIQEEGTNPNHLYWNMVFKCLYGLYEPMRILNNVFTIQHPGEYRMSIINGEFSGDLD